MELDGANGSAQILTGDYFAFIDVQGLDETETDNLVQPAGWTVSYETKTFNYAPINGFFSDGTDDPTQDNVVYTRTGGTLTSPMALGNFLFVSSLHRLANMVYTGNDHEDLLLGLTPSNNNGFVAGPSATGPDAVPSPVTAGSGLLLLALLGGNRLRRRTSASLA